MTSSQQIRRASFTPRSSRTCLHLTSRRAALNTRIPHSMGTAWAARQPYPWEHGAYVGGIETAKVNLTLRIYSNQWHVYAGLAILNPSARAQIDQFARSATELFTLMLAGD